MTAPSLNNDQTLRNALRRCRPEVVTAALEYRNHSDATLLPLIVSGVIERFVEPDIRPRLREANDSLRLSDDLGLDSLTMMEIVLLTEDVFAINISTEELRHLCTLGQIKTFVACKVQGLTTGAIELS